MNGNEVDMTTKMVVEIFVSDIVVPQNARCDLWKACVLKIHTFEEICMQLDYNVNKLLARGFNANFLTRERWLDISILVKKLQLSKHDLFHLIGVTKFQYHNWKLTPKEEKLLNHAPQRYGYA